MHTKTQTLAFKTMGIKTDKNTPPMERELDYLLYDLCVNWGFCIPPVNVEQISKKTFWKASEFAEAVISAEGMNPEHKKNGAIKLLPNFVNALAVGKFQLTTSPIE